MHPGAAGRHESASTMPQGAGPGRSRGRFNSAPLFYDNEFDNLDQPTPLADAADQSAQSAQTSAQGKSGDGTSSTTPGRRPSRDRSGSVVIMSGFFCPMCKERLGTKEALLAHCCGQSKQTLAGVRTALSRQRSVRLTSKTLEFWAKNGTPPTPKSGGASPQSPAYDRFQAMSGRRRRTVTSADLRPSASRFASRPPRAANAWDQQQREQPAQQGFAVKTGFICPHCKIALAGKRELLLHRCDRSGASSDSASPDSESSAPLSPKSALEKKRGERRERFKYWQQQCDDLCEGKIDLEKFVMECGPKVGVKPLWICDSRDGRSHCRVGPGNNTKSGRRLRSNEVLLELKHVRVEDRYWVAFFDHKKSRVMWTPTTSLSGKVRLRRYDPVRRSVVDDEVMGNDELPTTSRSALQKAVYHARMHKHAKEGRLKPGIPNDVSESMEFIKRLHEFRKAYPQTRPNHDQSASASVDAPPSALAASTASLRPVSGGYDL